LARRSLGEGGNNEKSKAKTRKNWFMKNRIPDAHRDDGKHKAINLFPLWAAHKPIPPRFLVPRGTELQFKQFNNPTSTNK
jgi:hypothetical protein